MEKKFSFAEQPKRVKIIYALAIAILCITAIVIGLVSAAQQKDELPPENNTPPVTEGGEGGEAEKPTVYLAPAVGTVTVTHSNDAPVFSPTLGEWRIHTGIDIATPEGAEVRSIAAGKVIKVYTHPMHGMTVEIDHGADVVSVYSNLATKVAVKEGDTVKPGTKLGTVGDTSVKELADEPHLHFEVRLKGACIDPLGIISEESKKASFGME